MNGPLSKILNLTFSIPKNNVLSKQSKVKGTRMKYKQTQSQTAIYINKGQSKFICVCVQVQWNHSKVVWDEKLLTAFQYQKKGAKLIKMHTIFFSKSLLIVVSFYHLIAKTQIQIYRSLVVFSAIWKEKRPNCFFSSEITHQNNQ